MVSWFCGKLVLEIDVLWIGIWLKPGFRKSRFGGSGFCGKLVLRNLDLMNRDFGNCGFEDRIFWYQVLENLGWKI